MTGRSKALAIGVAVVPALFGVGCGSSSDSKGSDFAARANSACAAGSSTVGSVYETVGERYKPFTRSWAAGISAGQAVAKDKEASTLHGLKPPSGKTGAYTSFIAIQRRLAGILRQERAAAISGDKKEYNVLDAQYGKLADHADKLGAQLGLSACARNGLSGADKQHITRVIVKTSTSNDVSECTHDFTAAFIKQSFGTMAKCIQQQKRPTTPTAHSALVSNVKGAGNFATADATFHYAGGSTHKASVAMLRVNGTWRLMGFRSE